MFGCAADAIAAIEVQCVQASNPSSYAQLAQGLTVC